MELFIETLKHIVFGPITVADVPSICMLIVGAIGGVLLYVGAKEIREILR